MLSTLLALATGKETKIVSAKTNSLNVKNLRINCGWGHSFTKVSLRFNAQDVLERITSITSILLQTLSSVDPH
jgi:hypothetical protein